MSSVHSITIFGKYREQRTSKTVVMSFHSFSEITLTCDGGCWKFKKCVFVNTGKRIITGTDDFENMTMGVD